VYAAAWLLFAFWWRAVSVPCDVGIYTYKQALYLSIETMMTIGYGVPDPFFKDCWQALPVLMIQSWIGLLIDLVFVGIVFARISRASRRANTIILSDKSLLRARGNNVEIAFRVAEMYRRPLLQVFVQAYCVIHRVDLVNAPELHSQEEGTAGGRSKAFEAVVIKALHLQGLDDNNNALLCGIPMTIQHVIDRNSPLAPCNIHGMRCDYDSTLSEAQEHLQSLPYVEIIVIVSGTEENTGSSVEGRQSYTMHDILSGREFGRCVTLDANGRHCIDFAHFDDTFPAMALDD